MTRLLTVVADAQHLTSPPADGERVLTLDELGALRREGALPTLILRFPRTRMVVPDMAAVRPSLKAVLAVRALSRGRSWVEDHHGRRRRIGPRYVLGAALNRGREQLLGRALLRRTERRLAALREPAPAAPLDLSGPALYLRTDLVFGLRAGGAVTHTAGVVNGLTEAGMPPIVMTPAAVPTIRPDVEVRIVPPDARWTQRELFPQLAYTERVLDAAVVALEGRRPGFVYQRSSVGSLAGLELARRLRVPFVLEYNGSDVWIARNWGAPLKLEDLALRIEQTNLRHAALITVVSRPLRDGLVGDGHDPRRVLLNPNGVDLQRFRPDLDGAAVRTRLGIPPDALVVGFIGTFGRWHGAEVLAEAFALLRARWSGPGAPRLLLVGDGLTRPEAEQALARGQCRDAATLTGVVPADDAPAHLAACDVLVSPHVPNADGTPFFGSPTKLFEYLAMGKAVVASDLDQIGDVLEHERTALLVPPGDPLALAEALERVLHSVDLRAALGRAARDAAQEHSWQAHVRRILDALVAVAEVDDVHA